MFFFLKAICLSIEKYCVLDLVFKNYQKSIGVKNLTQKRYGMTDQLTI